MNIEVDNLVDFMWIEINGILNFSEIYLRNLNGMDYIYILLMCSYIIYC